MRKMRNLVMLVLASTVVTWAPSVVEAQDVGQLFRKINPSVVVIRAKGREVSGA